MDDCSRVESRLRSGAHLQIGEDHLDPSPPIWNALVLDLTIVPRLLINSAFVIPIPVSMKVRVLETLSEIILITISFRLSKTDGLVKLLYLILFRRHLHLKSIHE